MHTTALVAVDLGAESCRVSLLALDPRWPGDSPGSPFPPMLPSPDLQVFAGTFVALSKVWRKVCDHAPEWRSGLTASASTAGQWIMCAWAVMEIP